MILVLKHIDIEGPGTLGEYFKNTDWEVRTIELNSGSSLPFQVKWRGLLPQNLSGVEAVISLGGPMNVYEEERFPFLKEENTFIKRLLKERVPFLGICLGAQLLAKACDAKVKKATKEEIGWYKALLTKDGLKDPLFLDIDNVVNVFQWHGDTFKLPKKAKLLATSENGANQAFRFSDNAYGLQFHIEVNAAMIRNWVKEYIVDSDLQSREETRMLTHYYAIKKQFDETADKIYLNLSRVISTKSARV